MTSAIALPPKPAPATLYLATAVAFTLAFACGAIDAFAFRQLGGIATLAGAVVAVLAFAGTLIAGFRLTGARASAAGPGAVLVTVLAAAAGAGLLVIALSAAALALQAAGARRITESGGVGRDGHLWLRVGSIPTLVAGAATGIAVVAAAPAAAPLISTAGAIAAVVLVRRADLHRH